jgi:hypothetical protein
VNFSVIIKPNNIYKANVKLFDDFLNNTLSLNEVVTNVPDPLYSDTIEFPRINQKQLRFLLSIIE